MGAFEDYIANPTEAGARELGRLTVFLAPNARTEPPPPAEIEPAHHAAFLAGYYLEKLRRETLPEIVEPGGQ
jgi:hypothetical protein